MQIRRPGNRRPSRLTTTFVALLYVFLSTFGALTHAATHGDFALESGSNSSTPRGSEKSAPAFTVACHCVFCGWQADSVSPALPIRCLELPAILGALLFTPPDLKSTAPATLRASSRAPPIA